MAHRERFMQEVRPGTWVVECRICPKRFSKRIFTSARECHQWWSDHETVAAHLQLKAIPKGTLSAEEKRLREILGEPSERERRERSESLQALVDDAQRLGHSIRREKRPRHDEPTLNEMRAMCSCGWVGDWAGSNQYASSQAHQHRREAVGAQ